jgi:hypothetical protein
MTKNYKTAKTDWVKACILAQNSSLEIPRKTSVGFFFLTFIIVLSIALTSGVRLALAKSVEAPSADIEQPFGERKTLRGHIGSVNKEGIAFITRKDPAAKSEHEMWLPFNKKVRLSGYKEHKDIEQGDEAVITYEEDKERTKRVLREVNFVSKPTLPDEPESIEPEAAE